jgi:lysozyme family protein
MSQFDAYYKRLLEREGGDQFTDYRYDAGGPTKFGITLATLRGLSMDLDGDGDVDKVDVQLLDNEQAKEIYKNVFFIGPKVNMLPRYLQEITFDMCVHFGAKGGIRVLQQTINSRLDSADHIAIDGVIGPVTLRHVAKTGIRPKRVAAFRIKRLAIIFANEYAKKETNVWYGFFNRGLFPFQLSKPNNQ